VTSEEVNGRSGEKSSSTADPTYRQVSLILAGRIKVAFNGRLRVELTRDFPRTRHNMLMPLSGSGCTPPVSFAGTQWSVAGPRVRERQWTQPPGTPNSSLPASSILIYERERRFHAVAR
jgi:hypothetical protein